MGGQRDKRQLTLASCRELIYVDVSTLVSIDVTTLMVQAQRQQLIDFQIRIMEVLGPAIPVLMEIDDSTGANRNALAPVLTVTYF